MSKNNAIISDNPSTEAVEVGFWMRNPDVISRNFTGEYILVPVKQSQVDMQKMFSLNEAGAFLWEELKFKKTKSELIAALYNSFAISQAQAEEDVTDFLAVLAVRKLIVQLFD